MELKYIFLDEDAIPLKVVIITAKYKTDFSYFYMYNWKIFAIFFLVGHSPKTVENKLALLWGEAQKKIAYCYPKVT